MTTYQLLSNVQKLYEGLKSGAIVRDVIVNHNADILELQKLQLLQGLSASGENMRPYYSEDLQPQGYFKSAESARRYADWKQTLSYPRQANRYADAPNLYINGKFHNDLVVQFTPAYAKVTGGTTYGKKIIAKYGEDKFGLTMDNWTEIMRNRNGYDELMNIVKSVIYA